MAEATKTAAAATQQKPAAKKEPKPKKEATSKRIAVWLPPSVTGNLAATAKKAGISINDLRSRVIGIAEAAVLTAFDGLTAESLAVKVVEDKIAKDAAAAQERLAALKGGAK